MTIKALLKCKLCVIISKVFILFQDRGTVVVIHLVFLLFLSLVLHVFPIYFCPLFSSNFVSLECYCHY